MLFNEVTILLYKADGYRCDATGKSVRKLPESKEGGNWPLALPGSRKPSPIRVAAVDTGLSRESENAGKRRNEQNGSVNKRTTWFISHLVVPFAVSGLFCLDYLHCLLKGESLRILPVFRRQRYVFPAMSQIPSVTAVRDDYLTAVIGT